MGGYPRLFLWSRTASSRMRQRRVSGTIVRLDELRPAHNWTPLLYAPRAYTELAQHPGMTPLASLAQMRIGLQSFAKCYIVPREMPERWEIERCWLRPFIMSPKDVDIPCLSSDTAIRHYILACDTPRAHLADTCLHYIQYWENQVLNPRGLARPVIGVQNLPRVGKTRRALV